MRSRRPVLGVLGVLGVVTLACGRVDDGARDTTTTGPGTVASTDDGRPLDPADVNLALVVSLSGSDQGFGAQAKRAAALAAEQLNALGGVAGRKVRFVVEDDGSDVSSTGRLVETLLARGVFAGLGPSTARASMALREPRDAVYVTPTASSFELDGLRTPLFRLRSDLVPTATAATEVVRGTQRCPSITVVRSEDPVAAEAALRIEDAYRALALRVEPTIVVRDASDRTTEAAAEQLLGRLRAGTSSCQVIVARGDVVESYARSAWQLASRTGTDTSTLPTIAVSTPLSAVGSAGLRWLRERPGDATTPLVTKGWYQVDADLMPPSPALTAFVDAWRAKYPDVAPDDEATAAYDAAILLAAAAAPQDSTATSVRERLVRLANGKERRGPAELARFLRDAVTTPDLDYIGASGSIDFDARGVAANAVSVSQIESGGSLQRVVTYDPAQLSP